MIYALYKTIIGEMGSINNASCKCDFVNVVCDLYLYKDEGKAAELEMINLMKQLHLKYGKIKVG